jgi:hypothetical protein
MIYDRDDIRHAWFGQGDLIHNYGVHENGLVEVQIRAAAVAGEPGAFSEDSVRDASPIKIILGFTKPEDIDYLIETLKEARGALR